jgi:hypothetical protein
MVGAKEIDFQQELSDRASNRRERLVSPALILEAVIENRRAVLHALPLADQARAGDRTVAFPHRLLAFDPPIFFFDQLLQPRFGPYPTQTDAAIAANLPAAVIEHLR